MPSDVITLHQHTVPCSRSYTPQDDLRRSARRQMAPTRRWAPRSASFYSLHLADSLSPSGRGTGGNRRGHAAGVHYRHATACLDSFQNAKAVLEKVPNATRIAGDSRQSGHFGVYQPEQAGRFDGCAVRRTPAAASGRKARQQAHHFASKGFVDSSPIEVFHRDLNQSCHPGRKRRRVDQQVLTCIGSRSTAGLD